MFQAFSISKLSSFLTVRICDFVFFGLFSWVFLSLIASLNSATLIEPSVGACSQDEEMATRAEVISWLEEYEQAFLGMEVTTPPRNKNCQGSITRISRNGDTIIIEDYTKNDVEGFGLLESIVVNYSCPNYSVKLVQSKRKGIPSSSINKGVVGPENLAISGFMGPWMLGFNAATGQRYSEIVADPRADVQIKQVNRFDINGLTVVVKIPRRVDIEFFFVRKPTPRILALTTRVSKGYEGISWYGKQIAGEPPRKDSGIPPNPVYYKYFEYDTGLIEYDKNGKPKRADCRLTFIALDGDETVRDWPNEIQSYRPLKEDLPKSQVVPKRFDLPDRLPVDVWGTNVPHELRDGRLVSLLDGVAMDVGPKVGFRSSTLFERYRWLLSIAILVALAGVVYYVYSKRTS